MAADDGFGKRPRDSRLIHMILASLGVSGYQERVPLQLMDFAYRYTSSTLQDALHLTSEGYGTQTSGPAKASNNNDMSTITVSSLRLSIASRTSYQFSPTFDKDSYQKIAQERNQVQLPTITKDWGVRLPLEQYCLTGVGWKLRDEFDSAPGHDDGADNLRDQPMTDGAEDRDDDGAEDDNERMEDFFGEDVDRNEEDQEMGDG
ncbi:MAG: hypothetical protein LQ350_006300 [Teloschistes chrysophthalmus]|nr:MAG: hypothetical protein LQ350_006300 [Niorma chrysophthalma]